MAHPKLVISRIDFDANKVAAGLKITTNQAIEAFRDGRGAWPFSEIWGARLYEFIKHSNSNNPVSDGAVALEQLRDVKISVKSLGKGSVKFQQSIDVGGKRSSSEAGLIKSIEACDRIIVVDVTEFPAVRFVPIDATRLLGAVYKDELTISGWSKHRLYSWLSMTYNVSEVTLKL